MIPNNVIPAFPKFEMRNPTEYTNKLIEEQNEKMATSFNYKQEINSLMDKLQNKRKKKEA